MNRDQEVLLSAQKAIDLLTKASTSIVRHKGEPLTDDAKACIRDARSSVGRIVALMTPTDRGYDEEQIKDDISMFESPSY